jgi:hypothetical protein
MMDTPVVIPELGLEPGTIEYERGQGPVEPNPNPDPHPPIPVENGRFTRPGFGKRQPRPRPETLMAGFRNKEDSPRWYEGLVGRAGLYEKGENYIWLSRDFCEYLRLESWVNQEWPSSDEHGQAMRILDEEYCFVAAAFGMAALSFRCDPEWSPDQWEKGLTAESLSCHMRDPAGLIESSVRRKVGRQLNTKIRELATSEV